MINITFLNNVGTLSTQVTKATTSVASNSIFLYFDSDDDARSIENLLKRRGYSTEHSEQTIKVIGINDFDMIFE